MSNRMKAQAGRTIVGLMLVLFLVVGVGSVVLADELPATDTIEMVVADGPSADGLSPDSSDWGDWFDRVYIFIGDWFAPCGFAWGD